MSKKQPQGISITNCSITNDASGLTPAIEALARAAERNAQAIIEIANMMEKMPPFTGISVKTGEAD